MRLFPLAPFISLTLFCLQSLNANALVLDEQFDEDCCCGTGKKTLVIHLGGGISGSSGSGTMYSDKNLEPWRKNNPDKDRCLQHAFIKYRTTLKKNGFLTPKSEFQRELLEDLTKQTMNVLDLASGRGSTAADINKKICKIVVIGYSGGGYPASFLATMLPGAEVHTVAGAVTPLNEIPDAADIGSDITQEGARLYGTDLMEMFLDPSPLFPLSSAGSPLGSLTCHVADSDAILPPESEYSRQPQAFKVIHEGEGHVSILPRALNDILSINRCQGCGNGKIEPENGEDCDPPSAIFGYTSYNSPGNEYIIRYCDQWCHIQTEIQTYTPEEIEHLTGGGYAMPMAPKPIAPTENHSSPLPIGSYDNKSESGL